MANPTSRSLATPPGSSPQSANSRNALQRAAERVSKGWTDACAALERAERHIMENFRQPPHGG